MAAHLYLEYRLGGASYEGIATGADYLGIIIILGMNLGLHLRNTHLSFAFAKGFKFNCAIGEGKEGVVLPHPHIETGVKEVALLAD